jgi:hypothetical protein
MSAKNLVKEKFPDAEVIEVTHVIRIRYRVFACGAFYGMSQKSKLAAWQSAAIDLQLFGRKP